MTCPIVSGDWRCSFSATVAAVEGAGVANGCSSSGESVAIERGSGG